MIKDIQEVGSGVGSRIDVMVGMTIHVPLCISVVGMLVKVFIVLLIIGADTNEFGNDGVAPYRHGLSVVHAVHPYGHIVALAAVEFSSGNDRCLESKVIGAGQWEA